MNSMIAYKLLRQMNDGSLAPLFINKTSRTPIGEWMEAENHPTKGFAVRKGWHCTLKPEAPHLKENPKNQAKRVWVKVEVKDYEFFERPKSQGGTWVLAQKMRIVGLHPIKPSTKMRHQLFFIKKDGSKMLLAESFVEWKVKEDTINNDNRTQLGIMNWEEVNLTKAMTKTERQILTDDEWINLQKQVT